MTDEEIIALETVALSPDSISYMEIPAPEFENACTWAGVAIASIWSHLQVYLNLSMMGQYTKARFLPQMRMLLYR